MFCFVVLQFWGGEQLCALFFVDYVGNQTGRNCGACAGLACERCENDVMQEEMFEKLCFEDVKKKEERRKKKERRRKYGEKVEV